MYQASRPTLLGIVMAFAVLGPLASDCPFALRSYQDMDRNGFVLELDPPLARESAAEIATARLLQADHGELIRFRVLLEPDGHRMVFVTEDRRLPAYFFTRALHSTDAEAGGHYLFLAGLDSVESLSGTSSASSDSPATGPGDVLWELFACKE